MDMYYLATILDAEKEINFIIWYHLKKIDPFEVQQKVAEYFTDALRVDVSSLSKWEYNELTVGQKFVPECNLKELGDKATMDLMVKYSLRNTVMFNQSMVA